MLTNNEIIKSRILLEKTKRIINNWNTLSNESAELTIKNLCKAIETIIYPLNKEEVVLKQVFKQHQVREEFHNFYHYLKNMESKQIKKTSDGVIVKNWKNTKNLSLKQLMEYVEKTHELIEHFETTLLK